jgi:hypothetical protein
MDEHPSASATNAPAADSPLWAPLSHRSFRWLWAGVLVSNIGTWMQTVGAQWLLVDPPNSAALVSLVPAASALAGLLVVLSAGVPADAFDRRLLFLSVQTHRPGQ